MFFISFGTENLFHRLHLGFGLFPFFLGLTLLEQSSAGIETALATGQNVGTPQGDKKMGGALG